MTVAADQTPLRPPSASAAHAARLQEGISRGVAAPGWRAASGVADVPYPKRWRPSAVQDGRLRWCTTTDGS